MKVRIELETAGTVWKVLVKVGDAVSAGDTLFIMEVMKMEVPYEAARGGVVSALHVADGDVVEEGMIAAEIEAT